MCVVNKQFEPLEFVMRFFSLLLQGRCACVVCSHVVVLGLSVRLSLYLCRGYGNWNACDVVLNVSMLRKCDGDGNAGGMDGGSVVAVSAGHEYVGGTRGSGLVSSATDVVGMSVVRGMRGVG